MARRISLSFVVVACVMSCRPGVAAIGSPDRGPSREPALAPETTREVVAKQEPDVLVARDATTCRVGPDVYARVSVGSLMRCRWLRV